MNMFKSTNSLYIEDISIEKDYSVDSPFPTSYILLRGIIYFEVPQWEGFGASFSFECRGFSTHLSKDLFLSEAIDDCLRNFYKGEYEQTDVNTTGWPGNPTIEKRIHTVSTNLIEEVDKFVKDLFSKKFREKEVYLGIRP